MKELRSFAFPVVGEALCLPLSFKGCFTEPQEWPAHLESLWAGCGTALGLDGTWTHAGGAAQEHGEHSSDPSVSFYLSLKTN